MAHPARRYDQRMRKGKPEITEEMIDAEIARQDLGLPESPERPNRGPRTTIVAAIVVGVVALAGAVIAGYWLLAASANDDTVDSWPTWGSAAVQQLNECASTDYACNHQAITDLQVKARGLPKPESGTPQFGAESLMRRFQSDYAQWIEKGCNVTPSDLTCLVLDRPSRLGVTESIKEYAQEMAN